MIDLVNKASKRVLQVKVKKEKKANKTKKKKKEPGGKKDVSVKKTPKIDHLSSIDVQPLTYSVTTLASL